MSKTEEIPDELQDVFETPVGELTREQKRRLLEEAADMENDLAEYAEYYLERYDSDSGDAS